MVVFTLIIAKRDKLASWLIREKAQLQANLIEAFDKIVEKKANIVKKNNG